MQNSDNRKYDKADQIKSNTLPGNFLKNIILIILLVLPSVGYCQLTEIGFALGAFNYTGDLSRAYNLKSNRPAASVYLRSNLTQAASLRYGLSGGMLSGNDSYSKDPFNQVRDESFNLFLIEAFGLLEFNFLDYRGKQSNINWTPYLNFGFAIFHFLGEKVKNKDVFPVQPAIPIGVGIKYQMSKKFDIGIEASARATFFDKLDGISGNENTLKDYDYGNNYDFDSYFFIGITLHYVFYYIPCPFDYN